MNYLKKILFLIPFIIIIIYAKNQNLFKFDEISIKGNNKIHSNLILNYIGYNIDSADSYTEKQIKNFVKEIKNLEKIGIINHIDISYSTPNQIIANFDENEPIYLLKTKTNHFILDNRGVIFDTTLCTHILSKIPQININITDFNIKPSELSDVFEILNWFNNKKITNTITSILVDEYSINLHLNRNKKSGNSKIIFDKSSNIINQLAKINQIINNDFFLDSLNIEEISDLDEINLSFNSENSEEEFIIIKKSKK